MGVTEPVMATRARLVAMISRRVAMGESSEGAPRAVRTAGAAG
jgi:hypothetical protein